MFDRERLYLGKPPDGTPLFGVPATVATVKAARRFEITSIVVVYARTGAEIENAYLNLGVSGAGTFQSRSLGYDLGPFGSNSTETISDIDAVLLQGEGFQACQFFHSLAACSVLTLWVNGREYQP
jgi:hypothetical protein